MAEWLGQLLGQLPGWLLLPVLLIVIIVAVEIALVNSSNGSISMMNLWGRKYGKK